MIVLRLILVLSLAVIAGLGLAWLFTRDPKYLRMISRTVRFVIVLLIVIGLVFVAERVILR